MREAVREDDRLAHTLEGEEPIEGIVLPACEEDFSGDAGAEGSDKVKNVTLARMVRKGEKTGQGQITGVEICGLGEMTMISWNGRLRI